MKLSNKLLIAFASALILIPVLGMVIVSRTQYKTGSYKDIVDVVRKIENFSTPTKNMESRAMPTTFESINIEDAKNMGIYINIIKDEKFGVKVPNELKDSISFNVDNTGQLQITFSNKLADRDNLYKTIWVYATNIKEVNVSNADGVYLDAKLDSLTLNVKKSGYINLQNDLELKVLNVNTDGVKDFSISKTKVGSLNIKLNDTEFKTEENSYDHLSVVAQGASKIVLKGSSFQEDKYSIKNLNLQTFGKADVIVEDIKINDCKGSFSDQTKVNMPAVNLNQMFKK